jgi:hypothetical protein
VARRRAATAAKAAAREEAVACAGLPLVGQGAGSGRAGGDAEAFVAMAKGACRAVVPDSCPAKKIFNSYHPIRSVAKTQKKNLKKPVEMN